MDLILVRHGETDWNRNLVFRGRIDVPLNETGLAQAAATAEVLKNRAISFVYSSPLLRAMKTAEIIARPHSLAVIADEDLIDIDYGLLQGLSEDEARMRYPELIEEWNSHPEKVRFPGGEGIADVWNRIQDFLGRIFALAERETVLVVSHRIPIKLISLALLGVDLAEMNAIKHDTCAISTFLIENGCVRGSLLNDTRHLTHLGAGHMKDF
ncbi:MAG: histidine phosphatase family protein [Methanomassiliicoccales archaeon]|jgi:broad specificity phosphatase PhoE|nr:histidine phosphatase family protein [Methanomassiliicoccales archaeon]